MAWLLAQAMTSFLIPGVKRRVTLEDSAAAVEVTLTEDDLTELDAARAVAGPRYGEMGMRMVRL